MGASSTLCLTICWVILAVWVPIGSAELRRLSVALSHSPRGSRASWNSRAKTCSSSNCLCLRDGRKAGWDKIPRDEEEEEEEEEGEVVKERFYWYFIAFLDFHFLLNLDLIFA